MNGEHRVPTWQLEKQVELRRLAETDQERERELRRVAEAMRAENEADDARAFFEGVLQVAWIVAVTVATARVLWLWWRG